MCKQLFVISEGTVQQSKVRKVSSFDSGRQIIFTSPTIVRLPWVPEVFLACGGNFRCWPKAEGTSGEAARKTRGSL